MGKINWKLRLKNKVTLTAIIVAVIAFVYEILDLLGITPAIPQESIVNVVKMVVYVLTILGIVVDPTTEGAGDSKRALEYEVPQPKTNE